MSALIDTLITSTDPALAQQGIELLASLADSRLFTRYLRGCRVDRWGHVISGPSFQPNPTHRATIVSLAALAPPGTRCDPSLSRDAVVVLNLRATPHLPIVLRRFTALRWLDISGGQHAHLPRWLDTLPQLEVLIARNNRLTAATLRGRALKVVDLSENALATVPSAPPLEAFYLDGNQLTTAPNTHLHRLLSLLANPLLSPPPPPPALQIEPEPLSGEPQPPSHQTFFFARGSARLNIRWSDDTFEWWPVADAIPALLELFGGTHDAPWETPLGPYTWSTNDTQRVVIAMAEQSCIDRRLLPVAQQLLAAAKSALDTPFARQEQLQWRGLARITGLRLYHQLVANYRGLDLLHYPTGNPADENVPYLLVEDDECWESMEEGWGAMSTLFSQQPEQLVLSQILDAQREQDPYPNHRIAPILTAIMTLPKIAAHTSP